MRAHIHAFNPDGGTNWAPMFFGLLPLGTNTGSSERRNKEIDGPTARSKLIEWRLHAK